MHLVCRLYIVFELSWYFWKHVSGIVNAESYTYVVYGVLYCSSLYAVSLCVYVHVIAHARMPGCVHLCIGERIDEWMHVRGTCAMYVLKGPQ